MRTLIVPSIIYNLQRAICAGVTLNLIFLGFLVADLLSGGTGSASFSSEMGGPAEMAGGVAGFAIVMLIAPIIYMPVGLVAAWLRRQIGQISFNSVTDIITLMFAAVTGWTALACLIVLMFGDPGVLLLKQIAPGFVPVDNPKLWNPHLFITVQGDPEELRAAREEADARREEAREWERREIEQRQTDSGDAEIDEDIVRRLMTSDEDPRSGLAWIDRLSGPARYQPMVMLARFMGLRKLALRGVFQGNLGDNDIFTLEAAELKRLVSAEELDLAIKALREVGEIQRRHPGHIEGIGDDDDRFMSRMVDDVCMVVERLAPAEVAGILGWTKLAFFGNERVGFRPGLLNDIPLAVHTSTMKATVRFGRTFRSAVAAATGKNDQGQYVDFVLLEQPFRDVEGSLDQAGVLETLRIFETGTVTVLRDEADDSAAAVLGESERQRLHEEATMLLKYEDNPDRIRFLRDTVTWLEGRGPRPAERNASPKQRRGITDDDNRSASVNRARPGGGFARVAVIAILVVALGGGAFYLWQSSQRPVQANPALDPNHFEVLPYAAQQPVVAREGELNIRALPFARPDVLILRETVAGEVLNVTGLVNQAEGPWYQVRLTDGRTGYFKASLAISQSDYISSTAGPPLTNGVYVQQGVCPFEGCVYRQWQATANTRLHREPSDNSEFVTTVLAGESVSAQTGEVHIIPLRGMVVRALGEFRVGDPVYRLSYRGEGTWDVWYNGRVADAYNLDYWSGNPVFDFGPNANAESQNTWWVLIRRSNGETGWSRETNNFEGKDQFG